MNAVKVSFPHEKVKQVMREHLFNSCNRMESWINWVADEITCGRAALWKLDEGWIVLSVCRHKDRRYLFVHCVEGKNIMNGDGMFTLFHVAFLEGCVGIMCETRKGLARLLIRKFGFVFHESNFNIMHYEQLPLVPLVREFF